MHAPRRKYYKENNIKLYENVEIEKIISQSSKYISKNINIYEGSRKNIIQIGEYITM